MSEVKVADDANRQPYKLEIERDDFAPDYEGKYLTSIEFCKLANQIFGAAFFNFNGSKFEVNAGQPVINLFFTHVDKLPDDAQITHLATTRSSGNKVGSTVIDKTRGRDNLMNNGDRYYLTDDGIDIIKPLLFPRLFNNGKPNWNQIVTEIADRNGSSIYGTMNVLQLTKVTGIDPKRVASLIWGRKDEDGDIDYGISVMRDLTINTGFGMPGMQPGQNYALNITRAHTAAISKTYESLGLGTLGSSIVR